MRLSIFAVIVGVVLVLLTTGAAINALPAGQPFGLVLEYREVLQTIGRVLTLLGVVGFVVALIRRARKPAPVGVPLRSQSSGAFMPVASRAAEAEQRGKFTEAAELFDRIENWSAAARCYRKAYGAPRMAGKEKAALLALTVQRLQAAGETEEAVELLIAAGDSKKAAELRGKTGDTKGKGELLLSMGDARAAAAAFEAAGEWMAAADALVKAGDAKSAVELLAKHDVQTAASFSEKHGQIEMAAALHLKAGNSAKAATLFASSGSPLQASEILKQIGDYKSAATLLAQAGQTKEAATLFIQIGEHDKAAAMFQKLGDPMGLPKALEAQKNYLAASRVYLQQSMTQEALRVLALLPPPARAQPDARLLAGACFLKADRVDLAVAALRPLLTQDGSTPKQRCEASYLLGVGYQMQNDAAQAMACYEQTLSLDAHFRDAALRLAQLRSQNGLPATGTMVGQQPPPPSGSSPSGGGTLMSGAAAGPTLPQRYRVEKKLGEGAMGVVFLARDQVLDRPVAIKVLNRALADNDQVRAYFLREARAAASLNHPNIITLFDAGVEAGAPYLVMEYIRGTDLETLMGKGPLPQANVISYGRQLADALAAVHDRQIIHRDIKPANVLLLEGSDTVKLMDFGVAHLAQPQAGKKATIVAGTPDFMPPEQLLGRGLGPWTDIYAFGGTLYQLLTGDVPFPEGLSEKSMPPDPRRLRPDTPAPLAEFIMLCLARDPKQRPQSARQARDTLAQISAG